eukprot:s1844_g13.t1
MKLQDFVGSKAYQTYMKHALTKKLALESVHVPTGSSQSPAKKAFDSAKAIHRRDGLQGSDAKGVVEQVVATVVAAQLDPRPYLVAKECLPVAFPAAKRLTLSWLAVTASRFPATTDALQSDPAPEKPKLRPLARAAAGEFVLAAVLLPVMASDIKALFHGEVYASGASNHKGAFCSAPIAERIEHLLRLAGDFKGSQIFLDPWQKILLKDAEVFEEEERSEQHAAGSAGSPGRSRPLARFFDFNEICGGSGRLGPLALEPPCTTFSPAAYFPCRSYNSKTFPPAVHKSAGLAFSCLTILLACAHALVMALFEIPRRAKTAWLHEWQYLLPLPNVEET